MLLGDQVSPYLEYPTTLRYVAERSWVLKVRTKIKYVTWKLVLS